MDQIRLKLLIDKYVCYKLVISNFLVTNFGMHIPYEIINKIIFVLDNKIQNEKLKEIDEYLILACHDRYMFDGYVWHDIKRNFIIKYNLPDFANIVMRYLVKYNMINMDNVPDMSINKIISIQNNKIIYNELSMYFYNDLKCALNEKCKILFAKK